MTTKLPPPDGRYTITEAQRKKAIEMYDSGAKTADIMQAVGIPRSSLYNILRGAGKRPSRLGAELPQEVARLTQQLEDCEKRLQQRDREVERLLAVVEKLTA